MAGHGPLARIDELGLSNLKNKLNDLKDLKAKFLDDFVDAADDVLRQFDENTGLVEGWKVLYKADPNDVARLGKKGELEEFRKYLLHSNKNVDEVAAEIKSVGTYAGWWNNVKSLINPFVHITSTNYKSFLKEIAEMVTKSGCLDNCSVVSISVALKLQGKALLDKSKFLQEFVGKNGGNGLSILEQYLKKVPADRSNMKRPFINPFPNRSRLGVQYTGGFKNLSFVSKVLSDAPNGSSFIFATYKGKQIVKHGDGYKGHTFNVIKDKDGVIKYLDGQLKDGLELGIGMDKLLEKMRSHGLEKTLPNGKVDISSWHVFDASQVFVK